MLCHGALQVSHCKHLEASQTITLLGRRLQRVLCISLLFLVNNLSMTISTIYTKVKYKTTISVAFSAPIKRYFLILSKIPPLNLSKFMFATLLSLFFNFVYIGKFFEKISQKFYVNLIMYTLDQE